MKWLNGNRMKLMLVGFVVVIVLGGGTAKADFTFGEPTNLGPPVNSSATESGPSLSADGLSLYFRSARSGGYGNRDLWVATRTTTNDIWGEPVNLGPLVNSSYEEGQPSISVDNLTLYFSSNRPEGYGGNDIWVTTRETIDDPWSEPVNLGPSINSSVNDAGPSTSVDGLKLYFNSNKDICVATRTTINADWSASMNLGPTVNSSASDNAPNISADDLWLIFHSRRPGGYGGTDLWLATRPTISDTWGEPVNLGPPINTSYDGSGACISIDGCTLYFDSNRPGGIGDNDLWQVSIDPVIDLNDDGFVDVSDICIMIDHWGTDNPLCDIGPMPWGDGIVDIQDLIVLAEHLFEEIPQTELFE